MAGLQEQLARLEQLHKTACAKREAILTTVEAEGRDELTPEETTEFRQRTGHIKELEGLIAEQRAELERSGKLDSDTQRVRHASGLPGGGASEREAWAQRAAQAIHGMGGEARALTSGAVDVPNLVERASRHWRGRLGSSTCWLIESLWRATLSSTSGRRCAPTTPPRWATTRLSPPAC